MEYVVKYSLIFISFIFSVLMIIYFSRQSFKGKAFKCGLIIAIVYCALFVANAIFYDKITSNNTLTIIMYSYILSFYLSFILYAMFRNKMLEQTENNHLSLKETLSCTASNVYFLCDKKDRIKEISKDLLSELGLKEKDVIGKKAFDVFDDTIRFTKVNDSPVTNDSLREYYKSYVKEVCEGEEAKREIYLQNAKGHTILLNLVERPIFYKGKYAGRLNIGQKKTDASLAQVERDLMDKNQALESIQSKFIAAIELSNEGIFFNNLDDNSLWGNDIFVNDLELPSNAMSTLDYKALIAPEDIEFYNNKIKSLTKENPSYEIRYRLRVGKSYQFVLEKGKRLFDEGQDVIIGFAKKINSSFYEHTGIKEIDSIKSVDNLINDLSSLLKSNNPFQLVCFSLYNLPTINDKFGRSVGNIAMSEYVKRVCKNFISESGSIYRASGLIFYFTITDVRKMEFFKRGLLSNGKAMNMVMDFGSNKVELEVKVGIADSIVDGYQPEELIKNCNMAINMASNPKYAENYAYFKDIKEFFG